MRYSDEIEWANHIKSYVSHIRDKNCQSQILDEFHSPSHCSVHPFMWHMKAIPNYAKNLRVIE